MVNSHGKRPEAGLGALILEDFAACGHQGLSAGFHALAVHRFGHWAKTVPLPGRLLLRLVYGILYLLVRNVYGIEIPASATIGRRLRVAHQSGIVVNAAASIGDDCLLRHNTTIGLAGMTGGAPTIGSRVQIGAGAVLVGNIDVGDDARIGPNAVVMTDVPTGGSAFAAPARVIQPMKRQE